MDSSTTHSTPTPTTRREVVFCHECHDEWYRDEKGIICPECQSEFTEIIEDDNDPRDNFDHAHTDDDDDLDDSLPPLEESGSSNHPLHNHNPWSDADDPEEADISSMRLQPIGPGRFHVQATIHRTISPAQFGASGNGLGAVAAFQSFLTNVLQSAHAQQSPAGASGADGQAESRSEGDGQPRVHRFTYSANAHLHPRDDDHPEPRGEPVDDLENVVTGLLAMLGEPPGGRRGGPGQSAAFRDMPPNPLMGLFAAMSGGQHGDAVYSQEALDRIVSQLMEQTATSNAPGPASQEDIDALPRKNVSEEMLGPEHRAECSICMDEVAVGEQVTELPCKHWFHHPCIAAWLSEHNTCPHCRKGIKGEETSASAQQGGHGAASGGDPTSSMPGAFGVSGEGTANQPYGIPGSSHPDANANPESNSTAAREGAGDGSGSGLGERLRRGLFGSPN
ncbi:hypothetical protein DM02DRAFT_710489 [Periconia macrospinosa]|uniref:RING-type E3 ubiquitin transferase n=1 Tax=Periconia macrospinosa TaxID=97972 RepID=A0A2V1DPB8_9PLEO|nr:hypothetical protein DM02DRAFT_710489 [Periconia macrospinosa]